MYETGERVRRQPRTLEVGTVAREEVCGGLGGRPYVLVYVRWDHGATTRELAEDIAPCSEADRKHGWT